MTWCRQYHALPYTGFPVQVGLFISQGDVTVPGHGMSHTNTIFTSFHPSHQSPKVHLPQCVVSLSISSPSPTHMGPHPPLSPFILLLFPLFHSLSLSCIYFHPHHLEAWSAAHISYGNLGPLERVLYRNDFTSWSGAGVCVYLPFCPYIHSIS